MRRLGSEPLTGAEKQRRHRERVKSRLAEAERLKALLADGPSNVLAGLPSFYESILADVGATPEERDALKSQLPMIQAELRALLEARARNELDAMRKLARRRASAAARRGV